MTTPTKSLIERIEEYLAMAPMIQPTKADRLLTEALEELKRYEMESLDRLHKKLCKDIP